MSAAGKVDRPTRSLAHQAEISLSCSQFFVKAKGHIFLHLDKNLQFYRIAIHFETRRPPAHSILERNSFPEASAFVARMFSTITARGFRTNSQSMQASEL
jgi:hypothetical protein